MAYLKEPLSRSLLLLAIFLVLGRKAFSQINITGTVTDSEDNSPIPGVSVQIEDTSTGTVTDADGAYSIEVPSENSVLVFSFISFTTQNIVVGNQNVIDVSLAIGASQLDEIIVVGYGTVKKSDITGSVVSVNGEDLNSVSQTSVDQILQGRVAGVRITQTNAAPGGGFSVRIRGTNSITAGNEPLYVIDGLPGANPLNSLNPSDIQSVEVLKDASATAIYGARGSNGVVIITTKQGGKGAPLLFNYNFSLGLQEPARRLDMMNAQEYMSFYNDVHADRGLPQPFSPQAMDSIGNGTDWQDEVLRSGWIQDHRLSFSGGSEQTQYYMLINYFDQSGIVINSGFQKFSGRINLIHNITDKLQVGVNFNNSIENRENVRLGLGVNVGAGVVGAALQMPPSDPIYDEDGEFAFSLQDLSNPVGQAETIEDFDKTTRIFGNANVLYQFLPNWNARVNLGYNRRNVSGDLFLDTKTLIGQLEDGAATRDFADHSDYLLEFTSEYDQQVGGNSSLKLLAGFGYQRFQTESFSAQSRNFSSTAFGSNNLGQERLALM